MRSVILAVILALSLLLAGPAPAQQPTTTPQSDAGKPGAIPRATVGWDVLAQVQEVRKIVDGFLHFQAEFGPKTQAMAGKDLTINGFMIPLEQKEKTTRFLLSAYAPSCPFCPQPGPADMIEVTMAQAIAFSYEPITLTGTLKLVPQDEDGLYYRLEQARLQRPS